MIARPRRTLAHEILVLPVEPGALEDVQNIVHVEFRQAVFIDKGEGRFEPRAVKLGARSDGYVEVREGVSDGEPVVVSANFLIDAESNLKAALKGFSEAGAQQ